MDSRLLLWLDRVQRAEKPLLQDTGCKAEKEQSELSGPHVFKVDISVR